MALAPTLEQLRGNATAQCCCLGLLPEAPKARIISTQPSPHPPNFKPPAPKPVCRPIRTFRTVWPSEIFPFPIPYPPHTSRPAFHSSCCDRPSSRLANVASLSLRPSIHHPLRHQLSKLISSRSFTHTHIPVRAVPATSGLAYRVDRC